MKKISLKYYKPAETAEEAGDYYCHVCGNESGTDEIKFKRVKSSACAKIAVNQPSG